MVAKLPKMNKTTHISVKVNQELKGKAEGVLSQLGLSMSDAVTLFLNQTVLHQGLPFPVRIPNQETIDAINEPREGLKRYASSSEMFDDILNEDD